jgi:hypothetical protein
MRQFASAGFRLWNLSREAKIVYTFFCVLALFAQGSSLLLYEDLVGSSLQRVGQYYAPGSPPAAPTEAAPEGGAGGGPTIALPEDAPKTPLVVAVPYRKLLEVTHFHLFTVPVFFLILTHLFMLTGLSSRAKQAWIVLGWAAASLHMLAPWLIRGGGAGWAWTFPASGVLLLGSGLVLTIYPVWVMWQRPPRPGRPLRRAAPEDAGARSGDAVEGAEDAEGDGAVPV